MEEFTAFVCCYNEEKRLPITLNSLKNFKNVIVIDKSSTDHTADIARKFGREVYIVDYFEGFEDCEGVEEFKRIINDCSTQWVFSVTCSDVYHPNLYEEMTKIINEKPEMDVVYIPLYRYSMGFTSKYSYYGNIQYQPYLYKKKSFDWSIDGIHDDHLINAKNKYYLKPIDKKVAIYHLTHENLDMILERHLRYARVEAETDLRHLDREECLRKSWQRVLAVPLRFVKLRTYKLKEKGKAQLCMLLLYRCANYLHLYFSNDVEKEIKEIYDRIRSGDFY